MNNKVHQEAVKAATKAKFKGKETLKSRAVPKYPDGAEREFQRVAGAYVRLLNRTLKKHLPELIAVYKKERRGDSRYDDRLDLEREIRRIIQSMSNELEQQIARFGLDDLVERVAKMVRNNSLREWKRVVRDTLGIDLLDDYYKGSFYTQVLQQWTGDNVTKIKSLPMNALGQMRQIVLDGYMQGMTIRDLTHEIQREYSVTRSKARSLARDQVSTLNAQVTKLQQTDAGCTHYRWSDSGDSRVRDCHHSLNDQIISWDDPPEMWYMRKSGIVHTGRRCHPGEDYCCRCIAIPVFNRETVNVPMKPKVKD